MEIRTKFELGQRVFFIQLGAIEEVEIKEISLTISYRGEEKYIEIRYLVRDKFYASHNIDEKELFLSKADILNALAGDEFVVVMK